MIYFTDVLVGWLVVLRSYVALAVFQSYCDLEAGDKQSLKFKWRGGESNPGPLSPQGKSLTTRAPPLPTDVLTMTRKEPLSILESIGQSPGQIRTLNFLQF